MESEKTTAFERHPTKSVESEDVADQEPLWMSFRQRMEGTSRSNCKPSKTIVDAFFVVLNLWQSIVGLDLWFHNYW